MKDAYEESFKTQNHVLRMIPINQESLRLLPIELHECGFGQGSDGSGLWEMVL